MASYQSTPAPGVQNPAMAQAANNTAAFGGAKAEALDVIASEANQFSKVLTSFKDQKDTQDLAYGQAYIQKEAAAYNARLEEVDEEGNYVNSEAGRPRSEVLREFGQKQLEYLSENKRISPQVVQHLASTELQNLETQGHEFDAHRAAKQSVQNVTDTLTNNLSTFNWRLASSPDPMTLEQVKEDQSYQRNLMLMASLKGRNPALYSVAKEAQSNLIAGAIQDALKKPTRDGFNQALRLFEAYKGSLSMTQSEQVKTWFDASREKQSSAMVEAADNAVSTGQPVPMGAIQSGALTAPAVRQISDYDTINKAISSSKDPQEAVAKLKSMSARLHSDKTGYPATQDGLKALDTMQKKVESEITKWSSEKANLGDFYSRQGDFASVRSVADQLPVDDLISGHPDAVERSVQVIRRTRESMGSFFSGVENRLGRSVDPHYKEDLLNTVLADKAVGVLASGKDGNQDAVLRLFDSYQKALQSDISNVTPSATLMGNFISKVKAAGGLSGAAFTSLVLQGSGIDTDRAKVLAGLIEEQAPVSVSAEEALKVGAEVTKGSTDYRTPAVSAIRKKLQANGNWQMLTKVFNTKFKDTGDVIETVEKQIANSALANMKKSDMPVDALITRTLQDMIPYAPQQLPGSEGWYLMRPEATIEASYAMGSPEADLGYSKLGVEGPWRNRYVQTSIVDTMRMADQGFYGNVWSGLERGGRSAVSGTIGLLANAPGKGVKALEATGKVASKLPFVNKFVKVGQAGEVGAAASKAANVGGGIVSFLGLQGNFGMYRGPGSTANTWMQQGINSEWYNKVVAKLDPELSGNNALGWRLTGSPKDSSGKEIMSLKDINATLSDAMDGHYVNAFGLVLHDKPYSMAYEEYGKDAVGRRLVKVGIRANTLGNECHWVVDKWGNPMTVALENLSLSAGKAGTNMNIFGGWNRMYEDGNDSISRYEKLMLSRQRANQ